MVDYPVQIEASQNIFNVFLKIQNIIVYDTIDSYMKFTKFTRNLQLSVNFLACLLNHCSKWDCLESTFILYIFFCFYKKVIAKEFIKFDEPLIKIWNYSNLGYFYVTYLKFMHVSIEIVGYLKCI